MDAATVARVFSAYEDVKRGQGRMDMEDVLLLAAALLAEDERVAAQVRRQYKFFAVDEYQDVSPLQAALLDLWLGGRDEICVVGDPAQTIYSFAGANAGVPPRLPEEAPRHHVGRPGPQLPLHARGGRRRQHAARRHRLAGRASSPPSGPSGPEVTHREYDDEVAEAEAVAAEILAACAQRGVPLSQIAVLFRINAQSEAFEDALAARGIRYVIRGAARFFDRQEVRQAITLLRGTARSGGAGDDLVDDVRATLSGMGWSTEAPAGRGRGPRPVGVAAGAGRPGGGVRRRGGRRPGRLRRRPRPAGHRAARAGRRRRHAGHAARRQGPRVGRGVRLRRPGGLDADHLRQHARRGRGGAAAALRRAHPRPRAPVDLVEPVPQPRRPAHAQAVAVPRRAGARDRVERRPPARRQDPRQGGPLPGLRPAAVHRRRAQGRPLRRLPGDVRRGAVRPAQGVAAVAARPRTRSRRTSCSPTRRSRRSPRSSPAAEAELQQISGIGPAKIEQYGEDLLEPFWSSRLWVTSRNSTEMPIKSFAPYRGRSDNFLPPDTAHHGPWQDRRPKHRRRWVPMNSINITITAANQPRIVMPTYGVFDGSAVRTAPSRRFARTCPLPSREPPRGPLSGVHRPVEMNYIGSLQAAEPETRDPRPFCLTSRTPQPDQHPEIRSRRR